MTEMAPSITVLLYHDVIPDVSSSTSDKGSISVRVLSDHIRSLQENGIEIIDLATAMQYIANSKEPEGKKCVITFDDAMEGVYHFLPCLLREKNFPASVFLVTGYVGMKNLWNPRSTVIANHMSLPMLSELQDMGVDLQLHGVDHHNLLKFTESELEQRFEQGIMWFKENVQKTPTYLSYPYGAYNNSVAALVPRYFHGALSVNHGSWWGKEAVWGLNRISVPSYVRGKDLVNLLSIQPEKRWIQIEKCAPWWRQQAG